MTTTATMTNDNDSRPNVCWVQEAPWEVDDEFRQAIGEWVARQIAANNQRAYFPTGREITDLMAEEGA